LADLGLTPIANNLIETEALWSAEPFYPLVAMVCSSCRLVQTVHDLAASEIFSPDYVYFSSHSTTWLDHAQRYVGEMIERFRFGSGSKVVEIASNDGYLLQFAKEKGLNCLGIEPCESVARAAIAKGIDTRMAFFGLATAQKLASDGWRADLIVANNVLAHVPDIADFVAGVAALLTQEGVTTVEVQHLQRLMQRNQFDTIYHEHYSYLSLIAAQRIFARAGLRVFDVQSLDTHGGSLRYFVCHSSAKHAETPAVKALLAEEIDFGLDRDDAYESWGASVKETKRALLELCIGLKRAGKSIVGYGAPAKAVTLLSYCGIGRDFIDFTVDRAPSKIGRYLPGLRIPILHPDAISESKPDFVLILPWNIKDEIKSQMRGIREWSGRFIIPVPVARIED
jgi:hypothetical protein